MHCSKFAGAAQHFLLLLQKKTLAKEKEPEGISISPQTPLNRPEKPLRFFWTFPAIAENPMRIRTTLWTFSAGYFAANIQTQLLTNPVYRIRRRVVKTRRVTTEWNDIQKPGACLNSEAGCTKRIQALFSPPSFLLREKRWGRRRQPAVADLTQPLSQPPADSIPTPFVPSGHFPLIGGIGPWEGSLFTGSPSGGIGSRGIGGAGGLRRSGGGSQSGG